VTEQELIKGCIRKDATCQRILFNQYAGRLMAVCLRYATDKLEAEDMLQEAFIKIFSHIDQFKFEGSFEGWLRRVVVNTALKMLQKKKLIFYEITEKTETTQYVNSYAYGHLNAEELMKLINNLPEGYKLIFNLNVIEGYSHDEIAQMLNIKASTSRSQLVKARRMLQEQIKELEKIAV
jgi:RNA polymerase sigma-70 factor (ECF subfamily)